jgi:hypothetical protein
MAFRGEEWCSETHRKKLQGTTAWKPFAKGTSIVTDIVTNPFMNRFEEN